MSWALSCLQFRQYYDQVELVTDSKGKALLVDQMKLPYTRVQTDLDDLDPYHPRLWALSKIYCFQRQQEPFIHADGDVFIWEKFDDAIEQAPLVAQHLEVDFFYYKPIIEQVKARFDYIPSCLQKDWQENRVIHAYNSGIQGGSDVDLLKAYARETFTFLRKNYHAMDDILAENMALFDQYFFYCYAREQNKAVRCYARDIDIEFEAFSDFKGVPGKVKYLHPLNFFKKQERRCEQLAFRLRQDYPEYYYRILHLLKTFKI